MNAELPFNRTFLQADGVPPLAGDTSMPSADYLLPLPIGDPNGEAFSTNSLPAVAHPSTGHPVHDPGLGQGGLLFAHACVAAPTSRTRGFVQHVV